MHACLPVGQQVLGSSSLHPPAPEPACTPLPKPAEQAAVHALFHTLARPLALVNCCKVQWGRFVKSLGSRGQLPTFFPLFRFFFPPTPAGQRGQLPEEEPVPLGLQPQAALPAEGARLRQGGLSCGVSEGNRGRHWHCQCMHWCAAQQQHSSAGGRRPGLESPKACAPCAATRCTAPGPELTQACALPALGCTARRLHCPAPRLYCPVLQAAPFFDKLIFSKIKEKLGGRVRLVVSGEGALASSWASWGAA